MWGRIARRALMIAPVALTAASVPNQPPRSFAVQGLGRLNDNISKTKPSFKNFFTWTFSWKSPLNFDYLCSVTIFSVSPDKRKKLATPSKLNQKMKTARQSESRKCTTDSRHLQRFKLTNSALWHRLIFLKPWQKQIHVRALSKNHSREMKFWPGWRRVRQIQVGWR